MTSEHIPLHSFRALLMKHHLDTNKQLLFSNSLIIHQVKSKEIITVTGLDLSTILFLRLFLSFCFNCGRRYTQTLETVFHPISKHLGFCQKYSAARRIFNCLLGVWKSDETLSLASDILLQFQMSSGLDINIKALDVCND